jgi:hypothetical protein
MSRDVLIFVGAVSLTLPLLVGVFYFTQRCYRFHGERYCRKRGLTISQARCMQLFRGHVKTEYYLFEADCVDHHGQPRLVRLAVWFFEVGRDLTDQPIYDRSRV